jgi:1-acyl-sn-glycerol-3-phosphate acyltransferase
MIWFKKFLQLLYSIYVITLFIACMLIAFLAVVVIIIVLPNTEKTNNLILRVCTLWARTWYAFIGIRHENIFEYPHDASQQYVFVANHSSYMDIPPIVLAITQPVRVLGKYEMIRYPIFGTIYKRAVVCVDRSSPERRAKSAKALQESVQKGLSIFLFPEGTFNESDQPLRAFYDGAFRIAIESQTPIKPLLLIDAEKRLHYSSLVAFTPGKNRVVFLETIPVAGLTMNDVPMLKALVYEKMEAGLRKYGVKK